MCHITGHCNHTMPVKYIHCSRYPASNNGSGKFPCTGQRYSPASSVRFALPDPQNVHQVSTITRSSGPEPGITRQPHLPGASLISPAAPWTFRTARRCHELRLPRWVSHPRLAGFGVLLQLLRLTPRVHVARVHGAKRSSEQGGLKRREDGYKIGSFHGTITSWCFEWFVFFTVLSLSKCDWRSGGMTWPYARFTSNGWGMSQVCSLTYLV